MDSSIYSHRKLTKVHLWKCPLKSSENLKKPPNQTKSARVKPKDLVTLERGRLKLFRYPTWGIGIYLGRGGLTSPVSHRFRLVFKRGRFSILLKAKLDQVDLPFALKSSFFLSGIWMLQTILSRKVSGCCRSNVLGRLAVDYFLMEIVPVLTMDK